MKAALSGLPGVSSVVLRFDDGECDVTYDPAKVQTDAMVKAVTDKGFTASVVG